jgi:hypothetical protein
VSRSCLRKVSLINESVFLENQYFKDVFDILTAPASSTIERAPSTHEDEGRLFKYALLTQEQSALLSVRLGDEGSCGTGFLVDFVFQNVFQRESTFQTREADRSQVENQNNVNSATSEKNLRGRNTEDAVRLFWVDLLARQFAAGFLRTISGILR